jgi:hypothetical protein
MNPPVPVKLEPEYQSVYHEWKKKNNAETREKFLAAIDPVLNQTAESFSGSDRDFLKLRGKILALNSLEKYDPKQTSLRTYLSWQLRPLQRDARQQTNILGIPERTAMAVGNLQSAETELEDILGRLPTTEELADHTKLSPKAIEKIRKSARIGNTGNYLQESEEGVMGGLPGVTRRLPDIYKQHYVFSALKHDPVLTLIYEYDRGLHGRKPLKTEALALKLKLSPGSISQKRSKLRELEETAERMIYGS